MHYYSLLGLYKDNGKEHGNYYSMLGLCRDDGKEDGKYHSIFGLYSDNGKDNGNYYNPSTTFMKRSISRAIFLAELAAKD